MSPYGHAPSGVTPTEQFVSRLCAKSFLRLWSYTNPYKDDGHEFCDVLAVFDNHAFIFFDREKTLLPLEEEEDEKAHIRWERWKRSAIDAQIKTAHGAERYLRSGRKIYLDAKKERPFPLPFNLDTLIVHKIIVANGAADACKEFSDQNVSGSLAISYGDTAGLIIFPFAAHIDRSCPVHILDTNTLPILLGELDTIKDLSDYFDAKIGAVNKFDNVTYCGEEDLLADYLLNLSADNKHFIGTEDSNVNLLHIAEGAWEQLKKLPQYNETKKANRSSYFWDELIDRTCDNFLQGKLLGEGDLLNQRSAIHEMAKEPRFIRRTIVDLMRGAIDVFPNDRSKINRHMRYIPSHDPEKGYVFLQLWIPEHIRSSEPGRDRAKRQEILATACGAARNKMPHLQTIIGIGIEPPKLSRDLAEDFVLLDCRNWSEKTRNDFEERNKDFKFFASASLKQYEQRVHEFVLPEKLREPRAPKTLGRNAPCPCGSGKKFKRCHGR